MTINLVSPKRIDWARPEGCPSGFDTDYVVVGNSDGGGMALEVAVTYWSKAEAFSGALAGIGSFGRPKPGGKTPYCTQSVNLKNWSTDPYLARPVGSAVA